MAELWLLSEKEWGDHTTPLGVFETPEAARDHVSHRLDPAVDLDARAPFGFEDGKWLAVLDGFSARVREGWLLVQPVAFHGEVRRG